MKRLISCLLVLVMVLTLLSGCAGSGKTESRSDAANGTAAEQNGNPAEKTSAQAEASAAEPSEAPSSGTEVPGAPSSAAEPSATEPEETKELIHPYREALSLYSEEKPRQVLVQDTDLYETMVHGRYFDLWDRRSLYYTEPELYGFENILINIRGDNAAAAWLAENVGAQALHQKADKDNYVRLLLMLIIMQSQGFSQAGKTLSDYDTLKTFSNYTEDFVDIGLDIVNLDEYGIMGDLGISLVGMGKNTVHLTVDSLAEYEMYRDAAGNYNNAYILLDTLKNNTQDKELTAAVDTIFPLITEARNMIFGGDLSDFTTDVVIEGMKSELFVNTLIAFMEESAASDQFAADTLPFVKKLKTVLNKKIIPGYSTAKFLYKSILLAGDLLFDTSNTYNRYAEMQCLSAIASALRARLSSYGYEPALERGGIEMARTAVPVMQFYLLTCMRGEYCAEDLVLNGGGIIDYVLGKDDPAADRKAEEWFAEKDSILSEIYNDADLILCTGNEVYYRYLENTILPEYGWAKCGPMVWDVKSLDSSANGNMADALAAWKDEKTGETATGVVSAIVHDFDGDSVNDMLVLFLDTAPIGETALAPVYKNATALVLKARLYTMQYSERPDDEPAVTEAAKPLSDRIVLQPSGGIPDMRQFFRERALEWQRIHAVDWSLIDRYTVVETDSIDLAAEFYGLGYGFMRAGLYRLDDVLYFYTNEHMDDYTTGGPGVMRTWHVEEGRFVFDYASRSIGWGQGSFPINLGDKHTDFGPLQGDISSGILAEFTAEITRYYNEGTPQFTTVTEDRSYIRTVLEEGEAKLKELRGEEPVRTHVETIENTHKEEVKGWGAEIAALSGIDMSLSQDRNATNGEYTATFSTAGGTDVEIRINAEGTITWVEVLGKLSEQHGEWQTVKDAVLQWDKLELSEEVVTHFRGDCGRNDRQDYDWGYVLLGNMDNIFIRIVRE